MSAPAPGIEGFVPGRHLIDAYGAGGFRFAGMSHVGSILATPTGVRAFEPLTPDEITIASLGPLFAELAEQPRSIEIFIVGTGEAMATGPAARVYNVLLGENRRVGAALIAAP
jgi:uncharacterized protein